MKKVNIVSLRIFRYILEWATFVGVIILVATFALTTSILPANSPPPTGSGGLVSTFGVRAVLWALFILSGALTAALFLLSRFPRIYRYPVPITAENIEVQYHLAKIMLCAGQLVVCFLFSLLMLYVYNMSISLFSLRFLLICLLCPTFFGCAYLVYYFIAKKFA